jgi:regulator of cell morphogenesis and NO signaling
MKTIAVQLLEPNLDLTSVFEIFDRLEKGGSITIQNDHDPIEYIHSLKSERDKNIQWRYLVNGPTLWKVEITKGTTGHQPTPIGEMVAEDFRKAEVFRSFGIDFCCNGKLTLEKACEKKGLSQATVRLALSQAIDRDQTNSIDYKAWELDFLADYIVEKHHAYVHDSHTILFELSQKVARVHGTHHPEVIEIAKLYLEVAEELNLHMQKEEQVLFPYIKSLVQAKRQGFPIERPPFGSIANPIQMMEDEHIMAGGIMDKIKELSQQFTPPEGACNSFRVLYGKLNEYELDLHHHIHLENNILFHGALELEQELFN